MGERAIRRDRQTETETDKKSQRMEVRERKKGRAGGRMWRKKIEKAHVCVCVFLSV